MKKDGFRSSRLWSALDERLGISRLYYGVPRHANTPPYMLGGVALGCFVILVLTGIILAQFYNPSPDNAYKSIIYLATMIPFGGFLRSLHYWAANFFIVIILLHLVRVFISGSYKKPREFIWLTGLMLLVLALAFYFTGTVLKQDQEAIEALTHNIGVGELLGGMGLWFTSGFAISIPILARVFFAHITFLVFLFLSFLFIHLYLIKLHGISPAPTPEAISRSTAGEGESNFAGHLKKLLGCNLILFSVLGLMALVFPDPLGTPGVVGAELTKPPWPFLPFYGMEDFFGFKAVIFGPAILFMLLALIPFIDTNPYLHPAKRKPIMVLGGLILATLLLFGAEAYLHKTETMKEGLFWPIKDNSFLVQNAYAHMIPAITVKPDKILAGDKFTVNADGLQESGKYFISIEGTVSSFELGNMEVENGGDSFDTEFTVPLSAPSGPYVLKVVHENDNATFYSLSEFEILSPPPSTSQTEEPSGLSAPLPNKMTSQETGIIIALLLISFLVGIKLLG